MYESGCSRRWNSNFGVEVMSRKVSRAEGFQLKRRVAMASAAFRLFLSVDLLGIVVERRWRCLGLESRYISGCSSSLLLSVVSGVAIVRIMKISLDDFGE